MNTGYFPPLVENNDHLSCFFKIEHPYESRIRQQYLIQLLQVMQSMQLLQIALQSRIKTPIIS